MVKVIEVRESVFSDNQKAAAKLRAELTAQGTLMLNVMSGPGSGKTTLLSALINCLKDQMKIALMDVDIETSIDATRVADATGVPSVQIHNGGLCHIDAEMTSESLKQSGFEPMDLLVLENIGNLVCPAEFDTGAHKNVMLLSVPEGDDKPLKYPLMFQISDLVIITKADTLPIFNFDLEICKKRILELNPHAEIFFVSAKTGQGMDELAERVKEMVAVEQDK